MSTDWLPELPEDTAAEASLLATLCAIGMEDQDRLLVPKIQPADFVHPKHRAVFQALVDVLADPTGEVHALHLKAALESRGTLNKVGGFGGLSEILMADELGRPQALIERLRDLRHRRELMSLGARLVRGCKDEPAGDLVSQALRELTQIQRDGAKNLPVGWEAIRERMAAGRPFRRGDRSQAGWWGLPGLDDQAPIPAGYVTVIGARPGVGKTALLTQVAVESAMRGARPLVLSLELSEEAMEARLASYATATSTAALRAGHYGRREVEEIQRAAWLEQGSTLSLPQGTPWAQLEAAIRADVQRRGCDLVLLDYFGYIGRPSVAKGSNEAYAYAAVSESITALSKELDLGFVLLAQLTKDEGGQEPKLSGFADSDRPARDAGVVLQLWHDADQQVMARLSKNRDGRLGYRRVLTFDGAAQRFTETVRETDPPAKGRRLK